MLTALLASMAKPRADNPLHAGMPANPPETTKYAKLAKMVVKPQEMRYNFRALSIS